MGTQNHHTGESLSTWGFSFVRLLKLAVLYSDGLEVRGSILGMGKIVPFCAAFRPALGPTQPFRTGVKRRGREADHSI
jgi:hypothetical protein